MKLLKLLLLAASVLLPHAAALAQGPSVLQVSLTESPLRAILHQQIRWDLSGHYGRLSHFHVRVFKGDLHYNTVYMKQYADKTTGCVPYHTWVLNAQMNESLHVDPLMDVGMLNYTDGHFGDGTLTLVFESDSGDTQENIRLHVTQVEAYFRYAKTLVASPDDIARSWEPEIADHVARMLNSNSAPGSTTFVPPQTVSLPEVPCYTKILALAQPVDEPSVVEIADLQIAPCGTVKMRRHFGWFASH